MSPIPFVVLALCGLTFVGGASTTVEKYPYQLSVRSGNIHFCSASIIGPNHALTAAHCVRGASPSSLTLHAGTSYKSQAGSIHNATRITSHPQYNGNDYDFAIINVSTPFPIGQPGIQSVELSSVEPSAGQTAVITGWGALSSGGGSPDQLQEVHVSIISRQTCQNEYYPYRVTQRIICGAFENGGKDSCQGDWGGPMVVNGVQTGVVSWGVDCADARYPGAYANVANQLGWIRANTDI